MNARSALLGVLLALAAAAARADEAEPQPPVVPEAPVMPEPPAVPEAQAAPAVKEVGRGIASWYGPRFHGRRTASGERFDQHALTAAHRSLPFGTIGRVTSLVNGRTVDVRINDRGPHTRGRIIDLSRGAAEALGLLEGRTGTHPVVLAVPKR